MGVSGGAGGRGSEGREQWEEGEAHLVGNNGDERAVLARFEPLLSSHVTQGVSNKPTTPTRAIAFDAKPQGGNHPPDKTEASARPRSLSFLEGLWSWRPS